MFILKGVKVLSFDTLLEVLILKGLTLHQNCAKYGPSDVLEVLLDAGARMLQDDSYCCGVGVGFLRTGFSPEAGAGMAAAGFAGSPVAGAATEVLPPSEYAFFR